MKIKQPIIIIFLVGLFGLSAIDVSGQTFKGGIILGMNGSQLNGDNVAGYNKWGLRGGVSIGVNVSKVLNVSVEMLFSQRGSSEKFSINPVKVKNGIGLNYIELPILLKISDYYIEKGDYYRFFAELGVSNGLLVQSTIDGSDLVTEVEDQFSRYSISGIIGLGSFLTKNIGVGVRYVHSFNDLYRQKDPPPMDVFTYLKGYYFSIYSTYLF